MAAVGAVVGLKFKLYRNTGTYGSPVWTLCPTVRDVNLNITKGDGDGSARVSTWKGHLPALKDASLEIEILRTRVLADHDAFRDAFVNDTIMDIAVADQTIATSGTEYWRADMFVMEFSRKEPLENGVTVSIKLMPYVLDHDPAFTTIP